MSLEAGYSTGVFNSGIVENITFMEYPEERENRPERTWMQSKSDNLDEVEIIFSEHTIRSLTGGGRFSIDKQFYTLFYASYYRGYNALYQSTVDFIVGQRKNFS